MTLSFFWYIGGKYNMVDDIVGRLPQHRCYVEVFGGSGVVLLNKPPSPVEVFNDVNSEVVNLFEVVRDRFDEFLRKVELTPYSRELHDRWSRQIRQGNMPGDPVERAARWYVVARSSIGGGGIESSWSHSIVRNQALGFARAHVHLAQICARLKMVQIEHRDFAYVIEHYDSPDTLFYCDPPYIIPGTNVGRKHYRCDFTMDDHRRLASLLNNIRGKALVSYYPNELVRELYPESRWNYTEIDIAKFAFCGITPCEGRATELLISNYEPLPLFGRTVVEGLKNGQEGPRKADVLPER